MTVRMFPLNLLTQSKRELLYSLKAPVSHESGVFFYSFPAAPKESFGQIAQITQIEIVNNLILWLTLKSE
jgi:hypothetical protein